MPTSIVILVLLVETLPLVDSSRRGVGVKRVLTSASVKRMMIAIKKTSSKMKTTMTMMTSRMTMRIPIGIPALWMTLMRIK
jgi:hypothetical protein